jgi:flavin-binding protein dodecin
MTVAKITELTTESTKSFDDAIRQGVQRATKTLHNVKSAWVKEQSLQIDSGQIASYRVTMKVTFVLDE